MGKISLADAGSGVIIPMNINTAIKAAMINAGIQAFHENFEIIIDYSTFSKPVKIKQKNALPAPEGRPSIICLPGS